MKDQTYEVSTDLTHLSAGDPIGVDNKQLV
jgi:hypothetical protein